MHGKGEGKEEAEMGTAVAPPLVVEWATIELKSKVNRRG
jgi:hypothetical protein